MSLLIHIKRNHIISNNLDVRILHSAKEDNLSPVDSKIAGLCQSIDINNNKYVYRQSQVRMPNDSGVRWAECLLIIGTGCRVQVLLAWSSIAQSVCQQAFCLLEIRFQRPPGFESCIQQRKTTCLLSIRKSLAYKYIASARAQFQINTHRCWNGHLCIPDGLSVVQCSLGHVIGVAFFLRNFGGMKRTCWTTGSWRSCLSLAVVSSIPAGSTIIYRFLCGFICVSLCQSIKIKPTNMYACMYVCMYTYDIGICLHEHNKCLLWANCAMWWCAVLKPWHLDFRGNCSPHTRMASVLNIGTWLIRKNGFAPIERNKAQPTTVSHLGLELYYWVA